MTDVKGLGPDRQLGISLDRNSPIPIAAQLEEQLTWLIATRALSPGDRLPSIRDLGAALGIHHHTVRQVYRELDARELITVRQGAAAAVREYTGLWQARPRYTGVMPAQGILIPNYTPFYVPFLRGLEAEASEAHLLTIVAATENNPVKAKLQMHQLIAAGVRGIIAASLGQLVQEEFAQHGPEGAIPVVYCDQPFEVDESITFGDADAGFELAAHLAGHGHRRISFMTPSIEYPNMANLLSGLKRAVSQDLIEDVDVIRCADFSVDAGMAAATTALTSPSPPTAIATAADEIALGVIDATRAIGLRIPQDLSLVSYGAIEASAYTDPSITTIALPAEQMGALAARRLAARIRGEPAEGTTILPGRLIVRASCGPHAA